MHNNLMPPILVNGSIFLLTVIFSSSCFSETNFSDNHYSYHPFFSGDYFYTDLLAEEYGPFEKDQVEEKVKNITAQVAEDLAQYKNVSATSGLKPFPDF